MNQERDLRGNFETISTTISSGIVPIEKLDSAFALFSILFPALLLPNLFMGLGFSPSAVGLELE